MIRTAGCSALVFAVRGSVGVDAFGESLELTAGEAFVIPHTSGQELACRYGEDAEWYLLEYRHEEPDPSPEAWGSRAVEHCAVARPERVTDLLRRYVDEHEHDNPSAPILCHLLELVLAELRYSRDQTAGGQLGQGAVEVIASRVDAFIAAHYHEPIGTFEIAQALRYNPDYLERVYRQERGMSIREAIQHRRIREAGAQLLLQNGRSVTEIALMCGFNDPSFFRRAFKKATNMTPHRFRVVKRSSASHEGVEPPHEQYVAQRSGRPDRPRRGRMPVSKRRLRRGANPIDPLNAGFFVSPGHGIHARRLLDSYELIFVTHGRLELFEGDTEYHLGRNDTLLLYPGQLHGGLTAFEPSLTFYWVHFKLHEGANDANPIPVPKTTTVGDPELMAELFCMFISDQESGRLSYENAADLIALMLCVNAYGSRGPAGSARRPARRDADALAQVVDEYIEHNYRKPISTATIAREMRFNPDYLQRVYRGKGERSIVRSLHERRIRAAREHLRNASSKNINEIARECGYNDPGYFRRIFKRVTGLTPKQYRSMFVQSHINAH